MCGVCALCIVCVHGVCGVWWCVCCVVCVYEFVRGASSITHTQTQTQNIHTRR